MDFITWMRLLIRNRFAVHWQYWYVAVIVTVVSIYHTVFKLLQEAFLGRRVARTVFQHPPLFVLGHWRTGTTLLHELLVQDTRHNFPTTCQCLDPNHFLLTENISKKLLYFLVPSQRPMDNMKMGMDRPQEDEFALCMLGAHTPYLTIAFPNRLQDQDYLDLENVPEAGLRQWKRVFQKFLQQLTWKDPRRIVLKSPPHTARVKVLHQMFPEALYVHIVRDPYVVFASTVNLWKNLYRVQGLQKPTFAGLEEQVYQTFLRIYERLEEGKKQIDPKRFYELKYEDLVRDPVAEMRKLYDHLGLGGFEEYRPRLEDYLAGLKGYETNKYQLSSEQRAEITRRWAPVIEKYGYAQPVAAPG